MRAPSRSARGSPTPSSTPMDTGCTTGPCSRRDPEGGWRRRPRGSPSVRRGTREALSMSVAERRRQGIAQESFWSFPEKTRATARPACCRGSSTRASERSASITRSSTPRPAASRASRTTPSAGAACRAFNVVTMEYFHKLTDRLTPAAIIPMHTPDEAVEGLEHATGSDSRSGCFGAASRRVRGRRSVWPILRQRASPSGTDTLGLDSAYDYDLVWKAMR